MSETTDVSGEPAMADTIVRAHQEADSHAKDAILPDASVEIDPAERRALIADFHRIRDAYRGRYAVDLRELPADPVRVATALVRAAEEEAPENRRHLLEDLVDLQAFVADPPASVAPAVPGAPSDPVSDELLERIRWRQATLTAALMGHPSILGDHNAIQGRWTPIGDARAAIDLINNYREQQTVGIGAMAIYPVPALVGFGVTSLIGLGRPSIVGLVALGIGWVLAPWIGSKAGAVEAWITRQPWRGTRLATAIEVVTGIGAIIVLPLVFGALVAFGGAPLRLP